MWRRHSWALIRAVLQDIAVDRMRRQAVKTAVQVVLRKAALQTSLQGIGTGVTFPEGAAGVETLMRNVARMATHDQVGVSDGNACAGLLTMVAATETVDLLALQLVLDPLAVRCVTNEGKDRPDALN